jgi:hypothetical protein
MHWSRSVSDVFAIWRPDKDADIAVDGDAMGIGDDASACGVDSCAERGRFEGVPADGRSADARFGDECFEGVPADDRPADVRIGDDCPE